MDIFPSFDSLQLSRNDRFIPSIYHQPAQPFAHMDVGTTADQQHPKLNHLVGLVCEAVLEVVIVSSLGYIVARRGMFDGTSQKVVANLNLLIFTPSLIFSKLASQLTGDKLLELFIIPIILAIQTLISWVAAKVMTKILKLNKKPQTNFVTAMAVFGNSNSLPLSLVISLSHTISGLHWDKVPNDNDDEVAARGILYLLCFSQLGQALRWSWGINTLLKPLDQYSPEDMGEIPQDLEQEPYSDEPATSSSSSIANGKARSPSGGSSQDLVKLDEPANVSGVAEHLHENGDLHQRHLAKNTDGDLDIGPSKCQTSAAKPHERTETTAEAEARETGGIVVHPPSGFFDRLVWRFKKLVVGTLVDLWRAFVRFVNILLALCPPWLQKSLIKTGNWTKRVSLSIWACLNVPLVAILFSVLVGSVPHLRKLFFTSGTFVNNTFTHAVQQTGGVAVPLILVVLGSNLAKNTLPAEDKSDREWQREKRNMLIAALMSRMLIPILVMAPILALMAKYLPISILDDPIFVIVCFLLCGAPSALQLAQICQVNDIYVPVVSNLLMHSYVIWIFPSTLFLVILALEVVKFAN